jgi:hypothetical protein
VHAAVVAAIQQLKRLHIRRRRTLHQYGIISGGVNGFRHWR